MASPNLSEIATTTIKNYTRKLADNVTDNMPLLMRLKSRGNVMFADGGETILQELEYAENSTYKRYSGYEVLNIQPSDVFTAAEFQWKQAAVAITISGLEQLKNAGRERFIPLLKSRVRNAEKTMLNGISTDIHSNGTADGGKQITGLQALVSTTPSTGTVGGINAANHSFWRNQEVTGTTFTGANIDVKEKMQELWVSTCRNNDKVDLITADNVAFQSYWGSLQDQQRFTDSRMAQMGFQNLKFNTADVILEGGVGGNQPASTMYFLNTDYIFFRPHSRRNMTMLNPDRYATNQDAMVRLIGFAGNMTVSNRSLQGLLTA